jgi:hypothetical protein
MRVGEVRTSELETEEFPVLEAVVRERLLAGKEWVLRSSVMCGD